MTNRKINFGAGPAKIPEEVVEISISCLFIDANWFILELINLNVFAEMSHRSKDFAEVLEETKDLLRELM
ncbi:hypothetical protein NECAME_19119 [Necator americanus]|uniref:Uncharacterized protein n=1 Tax=Necator americanus TaxID=51031 RepID=W2SSU0_NECAM|nr:hypothetical protein NECAME_19119 [Necator americanus]ETN71911.1 hypothetical protein NECAME_19119 [Necator americanus]